ncbi:uncharacterized protein LOC114266597 [Camellia sinensis]|nr:uncharacterized protein LOC114266597 [Camellia sinensis]
MVVPIPNKVKRMWREWNLRVAVLISLFFQVLLIFIAPSRKNTKNRIVTLLVWGAYLLADWIAVLSVGLICSGQGNDCDEYCVKDDLAAFWAPFLLLHLGGPDTITAFSLEDNELWLRHLLGLFIQLAAVVYAFWQSVPNQFQIPTIFMFFAGTIKYAERTRALYLACFGNLKHSMLPTYALLIKEVKLMLDNIPFGIANGKELETWDEESLTPNPLTDIDVVKNGYMFFQIIKRLIVFLTFTFPERHKSRKIFLEMTCKDAFRVMEMELNFMYDALYTKMVVVQRKIGYAFRFICSVLIVVSFALFASHHKHQLQPLDIVVTYTLLIGAVGLDFVSLVKLIFSNYTIVSLNNSNAEEIVFAIKERLSFGERCQRSNFVSQHSLISDCIINEQFKWFERVVDFFGLKDFFDEIQYKRNSPLTDDLKEFIFMEIKNKALQAEDPEYSKEICSAKGNWVLSQYDCLHPSIVNSVKREVEYDHTLLIWHVATDICYHKNEYSDEEKNSQNREFCKILSDYMLYLIVMQPAMMSEVEGIAQIRIQHTYKKAKKVLKSHMNVKPPNIFENFKKFFQSRQSELMLERIVACQILGLECNVAECGCKSVLFEGCNLAKELNKLGSERRWEIMSRVWVELLSYAATHCGGLAHAQQLNKGGEFITFVWLLMAHFGLTERLPIGSCMVGTTH